MMENEEENIKNKKSYHLTLLLPGQDKVGP